MSSSSRPNPEDDDARADRVAAELVEQGFKVERDEYWPESFGDRLVVLVGHGIRIELLKARGEWVLGLGSASMVHGGSFEPSLWFGALRPESPSPAAPVDEFELLFVVLPDVEGALENGWGRWDKLLAARAELLAEQLGESVPPEVTESGGELKPTGDADGGAAARAAAVRVARQQRAKKHRLK